MTERIEKKYKPVLSAEKVEVKRQRSEQELSGIVDLAPLIRRLQDKSLNRTCPQCDKPNHNNRVYCYDCLVPVGLPEENPLPRVDLPIRLDIIRHPKELKTKSTALHAQVIGGSDQVRTVELPNSRSLLPVDPATTLLLYPSSTSSTLAEIPDLQSIKRIVVVDSTWQQANSVLRSEVCSQITRHVRLGQTHSTSFWRYQNKGEDHLATIEAIYYFFRERHQVLVQEEEYDGRFDNLLCIFVAMLRNIEQSKRLLSSHTEEEEEEDKPKEPYMPSD